MLTKLKMFVFVAAMAAFLGATGVDAQKSRRIVATATPMPEANPSYNLDQCKNGGVGDPDEQCTGNNWINQNLNQQHAHWEENQFVSYRALFDNLLTDGTVYEVVLSYDVFHIQGDVHSHATDYLGTYDATETDSDPCSGQGSHCDGIDANADTLAVPTETDPALVPLNAAQIPGVFTMWGGNMTSAVFCQDKDGLDCTGDTYDSGNLRFIKITFTASVEDPVLAWSGHLAWRAHWTPEPTAGNIEGSPYHMAIEGLNGVGGRQDRSLSATAVAIPAILRIVKDAVPFNQLVIIPNFEFYASANFGPTSFFLNDNQSQNSDSIGAVNFGVPITVGETNIPATWSLDPPTAASCVETGTTTNFPFTFDGGALSYSVSLLEADDVTCTFRNVQQSLTAAPAYVAGRVTDAYGRGISMARVSVFNAETGASVSVYTNTFGYYKVNDLAVGDLYVMNVSHRRYSFVSGSTSFTLDSDLTGMNFQASN